MDFESEIEVEEEYSFKLNIANPKYSKSKWEIVGLDEHLKASTMAGLIDKFIGASNYLNDKNSLSQVSRVLVLQTVAVKQRLNLLNPVDFEVVKSHATNSTHAVVAVTYGLEAYCVIFQDLNDKESQEDVDENLSDLVNKLKESLSEKHDWNNFQEQLSKIEKELTLQLKCRLYTDLQTQTVRECNVSDAYKHCFKLIEQVQQSYEGENKFIPISVSLCPLKLMVGTTRGAGKLSQYRDVLDDIVSRCWRIWTELERIIGEVEDFRVTIENKNSRTTLRQFAETIINFQHIFKKDLKIAVIKARENAYGDDDEIKKIVDVVEKHPLFKPKRLKRWLEYKIAELDMAEKIGNIKGITVFSSKKEVKRGIRNSYENNKYTLVMWIPPLDGKTKEILKAMTDYVESCTKLVASFFGNGLKDNRHEDEEPWHMDDRKQKFVNSKIRQYADYVSKNKCIENQIQYFLASGEIGIRLGCRYSVYKNERALKEDMEELPCPPTNLRIQPVPSGMYRNDNKSPSICVLWDYEDLGYPHHFVVEYRMKDNNGGPWNQLKTHKQGETQFTLIIPAGEVMEVRVAADTCIGRSEFSDIVDTESFQIAIFTPRSDDFGYEHFDISSQSVGREKIFQGELTPKSWNHGIVHRQETSQRKFSYSSNSASNFQYSKPLPITMDQPSSVAIMPIKPIVHPIKPKPESIVTEPISADSGYAAETAYRLRQLTRQGQPTPAPSSSNFLSQLFTPRVNMASPLQSRNVRFSETIRDQCNKSGHRNGIDLYSVPMTKSSGTGSIAERFYFGRLERKMLRKTILVMGATGSGKTTLINSMINYIFDVQWTDNFRFQLIQEQIVGQSQAHSQTSKITAYDIYHQEGFRVPYSVTIVDTPGYGDTKGFTRDQEITEMIRQFFEDKRGIQELDVVGFVASASSARLTPVQMYIFDSILSIFGKDVKENIDFLLTFADSQEPLLLESITEADLPCPTDSQTGDPLHHKFNNSGFFCSNRETGNNSDRFSKFFWEMGMESFNKFFNELIKMKTKSLSLTKEVLKERKQLEATVEGLQSLIKISLSNLEEMRKLKQVVSNSQAQIDANRNAQCEFQVNVPKKVEIPSGTFLTNCKKCKVTCHYPCSSEEDGNKFDCSAMDKSMPETTRRCNVCPNKCLWTFHTHQPYKWEYVQDKQTTTFDAIKAVLDPSLNTNMTSEDLIQSLEKIMKENKVAMLEKVEMITKCIIRLEEIALRPNPFSSAQYIDLIIDGERGEQRPGFEERVESLERLRDMALITNKVINKSPLFEIIS